MNIICRFSRVGPIAFFYNCVLPRCVLKRNRACTVAFKTQLDKIRLRFKRNRAKHSCVLNAKRRSPVAFFDKLTFLENAFEIKRNRNKAQLRFNVWFLTKPVCVFYKKLWKLCCLGTKTGGPNCVFIYAARLQFIEKRNCVLSNCIEKRNRKPICVFWKKYREHTAYEVQLRFVKKIK